MIKWYKPSEKYKEYLQKSGEMYSTHGENSYYAGYELAQKEMQEKLDICIQLAHTKSVEMDEVRRFLIDIAEYEHDELAERARDFLKVRGE